jgi:F-type H+-transporting ATPase subunit epsilon
MLNLSIYSIKGTVFEGNVDWVNLPGSEGQLTILPKHIPLITYLKNGKIRVKRNDEVLSFEINSGILEVRPKSQVKILIEV